MFKEVYLFKDYYEFEVILVASLYCEEAQG